MISSFFFFSQINIYGSFFSQIDRYGRRKEKVGYQVLVSPRILVSEHGCTDFTDFHQRITTWVMKKFDQKDGIAIIDKLAGFGWVNCGLLAF
jgi:hypothetical protein